MCHLEEQTENLGLNLLGPAVLDQIVLTGIYCQTQVSSCTHLLKKIQTKVSLWGVQVDSVVPVLSMVVALF